MPSFRTKVANFAGKKQANTFIQATKNFLNDSRLKSAVNVASEIFTASEALIENPNPWNIARTAINIAQYIVEDAEVWPCFFEESDDWVEPYSRHFNGTILRVLSKHPFTIIKTPEDSIQLRIINVDGIKIGCAYDVKLNAFDKLYAETVHVEATKKIIKDALWAEYKDKAIVLRNLKSKRDSDDAVEFEVEDALKPLPSKKATECSSYLGRCFAVGINRSIMLCGPPGTGKSTMARMIVDNLGMRSLRFAVEDIEGYGNKVIFEAINIFQPDAIILDDFDRSGSQASLLETLEFFQRHVKLVIATVNEKDNLDDAILRPGRFDELIWVEHIDEAVVRHVLGEFMEDFEVVKSWPIAFISEYVKRRKFMTPEEATQSMVELADRVSQLTSKKAYDESWSDLRNLKKSKAKRRVKKA